MAKLTDDQLRFIIDLDASGAQGQINTLTAEISKLEKENQQLAAANRETAKEIKALEKQLASLEKQGKQNTTQYQQLTQQLEGTKNNYNLFNQTIKQNLSLIEQNQNRQQQLTSSLKLQDMTMNQLKERARQLQQQLSATSASASPEAYNKLATELAQTQGRITELNTKQKALNGVLGSMPGTLGNVVRGFKTLSTAIKAVLATNPFLLALAAAITAIVAAFKLVQKAIQSSDSLSTKFAATMAALNSVLDSTGRILATVGGAIADLFTGKWDNLKKRGEEMKLIFQEIGDSAKQAFNAAIAQDALQDQMRQTASLIKLNEAEIARLRETADDATKSIEERTAALKRMIALEKENFSRQLQDLGDDFFEVWEKKNANVVKAFKATSPELMQLVENNLKQLQRGQTLTYSMQRNLVNATMQLIRDTDNVSEEQKDEFKKFIDDMIALQTSYYSATRASSKRLNSMLNEQQKNKTKQDQDLLKLSEQYLKEDLDNAKEYYQEQLTDLKQQYANREITTEEFQQQQVSLQLQHLQTLRRITEEAGLSTVELDGQIADLRIKINQDADKKIEDSRRKTQEQLKQQADETIKMLDNLAKNTQQIASNLSGTLGGELLAAVATTQKGISDMTKTLNSETATIAEKTIATAQGIATATAQALNMAADITTKIFELETANLEAEKQKQLTIAGDNAEERARVEQEYAQKELDLKKRQADADAGVQSAQLWINTAMGVASAWASCMPLGPIAGPIAAALLTSALLATAGIEQALIVKQRDAIKNQTLDSSSTASTSATAATPSASTAITQDYTLKKQYAEGFSKGGYTGDGAVLEPAGIVHRGEYVIPQAELQNPTVVPMVRKIEAIRQQRLRTTAAALTAPGFASGGYTDSTSLNTPNAQQKGTTDSQLTAVLGALQLTLNNLQQQGLKATVNYQQFQQAEQTIQQLNNRSKR